MLCERWMKFENFLTDVGERPSYQMTLDRIDNDRGYEPGNVRWATKQQQVRNMRKNILVEHDGETLSIAEWGRRFGIAPATLKDRIVRRKMTPAEAFTMPGRGLKSRFAEEESIEALAL